MTRFQFVADHQHAFEVKRLCQVVEIGRSSYYKWHKGAEARATRKAADDVLAARIEAVHKADTAMGTPRITAELNDGVEPYQRVNRKRVARVMRDHGIQGLRLRRKKRTTIADPNSTPVPDLLNRDFTAPAPNLKYVGDITYLPYGNGQFLYLATVIDCHSRRLAGWAIGDHMRTSLVADALRAAARERGSLTGAIAHHDYGAQYGSKDYVALCDQLGVRLSMGAVGSSADNALAESFNATLKRETLKGAHRWATERDCRLAVFRWVNRYNNTRRHSWCGYQTPVAFEQAQTANPNPATPVTTALQTAA